MIQYNRFTLSNGLRVLVHQDPTTQIAAVNILYDVGARDEAPDRTGFAHLFEHLMFGGSKNIPRYDTPLEQAGGENNAFTNNDITNYYLTIPRHNLELAFWLESDRMLDLAFTPKSLEVQRNVVIEEFKQSYLNQPYGDVWLLLRPLAYKVHPYQWSTIGKEISHIAGAGMEEVKEFYRKFYNPDNAIMVVAGNVETEEIERLSEKWFGPIPSGNGHRRVLPQEPEQTEKRTIHVEREVPADALYMAFHMPGRQHTDYYTSDLISDILSNGDSSRLFRRLLKEKQLFSDIQAYITGDRDPGLLIVQARLNNEVTFEQAEEAIFDELNSLASDGPDSRELEKVKNKIESTFEFSEMNVLNKAMNLAYYELLGDAGMINREVERYRTVTGQQVKECAQKLFRQENCSVLYYHAKK